MGDEINEGDVICSIETDKAQVDFEATDPGWVAKILVGDNASDVPVSGTRVCSTLLRVLTFWRSGWRSNFGDC